jgi:hypothetical protein
MCVKFDVDLQTFHTVYIFYVSWSISVSDLKFKTVKIRSVWVRNLVSDIKGRTQTEDVWEKIAEENICT